MIKNPKVLRKFEDEIIRQERVDIQKNFSLIEAMYNEAVVLGVFPLKEPLSGIDIDIRIAKAINSVSANP